MELQLTEEVTELCYLSYFVKLFSYFADYMAHQLAIAKGEVPKMCLDLYKEYGTTMAGLKVRKVCTKIRKIKR